MDSEIQGKNRKETRQLRRLENRRQQKTRNQPNVVNNDAVKDSVLTPGTEAWGRNVERIATDRDSYTVAGQNFLVLQFVNERTNIKSKEPALKFKGVFATLDDADDFIKRSRPYDNNSLFDTIAVDMGTWMVMPPRPGQFFGTKIVYDHPELQRIMDQHLRHVTDDFNSVRNRLNLAQRSAKPSDTVEETVSAEPLSVAPEDAAPSQEAKDAAPPQDEK